MSAPNTVVCTARHDEYLLREERSFNLAALSTNVYVPMRPVPLECFLTLCRTCCLHCVDPFINTGALQSYQRLPVAVLKRKWGSSYGMCTLTRE
ncbi:uncharacterized protein LOC119165636 isoform X2 [Rhipicephalus microplus]|uniref:uncharacterized protein LOC119165636 isoform X2 n=1 Tax=Rhipicephalus microplus TaxID=6941 RepID=UPI003F6D173B